MVDGQAHLARLCYRVVDVFDRYAIDRVGVDGPGFVVRNILNKGLRFMLVGKVQFYFIILFLVLGYYLLKV